MVLLNVINFFGLRFPLLVCDFNSDELPVVRIRIILNFVHALRFAEKRAAALALATVVPFVFGCDFIAEGEQIRMCLPDALHNIGKSNVQHWMQKINNR